MEAELGHHIDCETEDLIRQGLPPDEARRRALRDFGGIERIKEDARDVRGARAFEDGIADARYAARLRAATPFSAPRPC